MKTKKTFIFVISVCILPTLGLAEPPSGVTVGVLPFETFGATKSTNLGNECALLLADLLGRNPAILPVESQQVKSVLAGGNTAAITPERLKQVAKLLNANFLVFGSVTTVRDELSIDAQIYYNFPGDEYFKTYAEGSDTATVVAEIARKIEQEIVDKADLVPPAQRPKVTPVTPSPQVQDAHKLEYEKYVERALTPVEQAQPQERQALSGKQTGGVELEESELTRVGSPLTKSTVVQEPPITKTDLTDVSDNQSTAMTQGVSDKKSAGKTATVSGITLDQPVNITADSLEYDNKSNSAVFRGNVVARQSDVVLFADSVSVIYAKAHDQEAGRGKIQQLTAEGNVKVIQGERIATGQKIIFYNDEQKIVATGNPRVWQGDNVIMGNKITVYLKEDRSVVEGTFQERVSATIYPKEKKTQKR